MIAVKVFQPSFILRFSEDTGEGRNEIEGGRETVCSDNRSSCGGAHIRA